MEECGETSQRASKAQRFGHDEVQPGQELNNGERIILEHCDQLAILDLLTTAGICPAVGDLAWIESKKPRIRKWLELTVGRGLLSDSVLPEFDALLEADAVRRARQTRPTSFGEMPRDVGLRVAVAFADAAELKKQFEHLDDEGRVRLLDFLGDGICHPCGRMLHGERCHCENDD